jgi:hypothetical protein
MRGSVLIVGLLLANVARANEVRVYRDEPLAAEAIRADKTPKSLAAEAKRKRASA